jgi:hypothetical protein
VLLCQSSELGRSNECEIGRIKEQYRPSSGTLLLREGELREIVIHWIVGVDLEIGYFVSKPYLFFL